MPNTFSQIHIQAVFAVKNRESLIHDSIRDRVEKYITGIVQKHEHKVLAVYCMPDHTHLFVGLRPSQSLSDLMRDVKSGSSEFINQHHLVKGRFSWQAGYGAFSYSHSHVISVIDYVLNQSEHHKKKTFKEEYLEFLNKFEVSYDDQYLFEWIE